MSIKENFEDINSSMVYRGVFWIKVTALFRGGF